MIDKLTQSQIDEMPKYVDKWLKIGLSTERVQIRDCQKSADYFYKRFRNMKTPPIIVFDGVLSAWIGLHLFIKDSVRDSVRASVRDSVRASVWASVRASVRAYYGSFFILSRNDWKYTEKIKTDQYPFLSVVKLWEMGLVSSYDGKKWRLHGGKDVRVLWEGTI